MEKSGLPERGPEEMNRIGVCSLQELGILQNKNNAKYHSI